MNCSTDCARIAPGRHRHSTRESWCSHTELVVAYPVLVDDCPEVHGELPWDVLVGQVAVPPFPPGWPPRVPDQQGPPLAVPVVRLARAHDWPVVIESPRQHRVSPD